MNDTPREILVVSATVLELEPLLRAAGIKRLPASGEVTKIAPHVSLLITGIGQAAAAYFVGVTLAGHHYDFVLNAGICGTFDPAISIRTPVVVVQEAFADLGAERTDRNIDLFQMKLADPQAWPFVDGKLSVSVPDWPPLNNLRRVSSVTVNRVLRNAMSIEDIRNRYNPDVVNMEGAAVFFACLHQKTNVVSLRTISDVVDPDSRVPWDIQGAVDSLSNLLQDVMKYLNHG